MSSRASRLARAFELRVGQLGRPRRPPPWHPGSVPPAPRTAPAACRRGHVRAAVVVPARSSRCRSSAVEHVDVARPGGPGRRRPRPAARTQPVGERLRPSRRSKRSVAYSSVPVDAVRRRRRRLRLREAEGQVELGGVGARSDSARPSGPAGRSRWSAVFWKASITWNSGWRASDRTGLSASTSRSNGTSWWA